MRYIRQRINLILASILIFSLLCIPALAPVDTPDVTATPLQYTLSITGKGAIAPVLIYSLSDPAFALPLPRIPYYQRGSIQFMPEYFFEQFKEGHQPWLAGAVDVATVNCSHLIGPDSVVRQVLRNENIESHTARELKTKDGVHIKVVDEMSKNSEVEMTVPGSGKYDITLESPAGTGILFIRQIVFHPDIMNNALPGYEAGNVVFSKPITYAEWENRGGHQPWRMEPFELMQIVASNLVPENVSPHYLEEAWGKSGNTATNKDGVAIKLRSPNDGSLNNSSNAATLTYELVVPQLGLYEITVSRPYNSVFFIIPRSPILQALSV